MMELGTLLIVLIIFGLISFVIEKIGGFSPYQAYIAIGVVTVVFSMLYILWPVMNSTGDINALTLSINRLTKWLVNFLPGAIIGDVAGVFISKLTGGR